MRGQRVASLIGVDMNIIFVTKELRMSKLGSITAPIFFDFGDYKFPELNWSDFPVVIMKWWLDSFSNFLSQASDSAELLFMDGPMLVKVRAVSSDESELICINQSSKSNEIIEFTCIIHNQDFMSLLIDVAQDILTVCKEADFQSDDIESLQKALIACS